MRDDPELFTVPRVAWASVAVFACLCAGWLTGLLLGVTGRVPVVWAVALCTVSTYAAFTTLHEALHQVLGRVRVLNVVLGRVSGWLLLAPFPAFRHLHLRHHRHTNDPEQDPDHYSGRGPWWRLPLQWATQDLYYYSLYLRELRAQSLRERVETVVTFAAEFALFGALAWAGYAKEALLYWVLPARAATAFLAFSLNYLPHRPHTVLASVDRYRATRVLAGPLANVFFLGQCYHLIHHLYPGVPWYRYQAIWRAQAPELLARGAEVRTLI